jgi:hypothetical protein
MYIVPNIIQARRYIWNSKSSGGTCWRKDRIRVTGPDRALHIPASNSRLCHSLRGQRRLFLSFLLVHEVFELGVEVAFTAAHNRGKVDLLKRPRRGCFFERNDGC